MKRLLIVLFTGLSFLASSLVMAQESEMHDTLTASRVSADHLKTVMRTQTGLTHLSGEELNGGFAVFSSPDLIKTLQLLPGVASGTELMSGLFVHGGTGGDNLFMLDGSSIYSTSHLIGLFSAFNSDVIDGLDFYKSGFPARYGGRLSSVVDVTTRDGDLYDSHGTFSIGLIDGRVQWEGPLVRGKTSLQFGLRRTWLEVVSIPALLYINSRNGNREKNRGNYGFWDLNIGVTHHLTNHDILRFRVFNGMDRLRLGQDALSSDSFGNMMHQGNDTIDGVLNWGSTTAGLTWNHVFSDRLVVRTGAYYSFNLSKVKYGSRFWDWDSENGSIYSNAEESDLSGVHGIRLGVDFDWEPSNKHHARFGASLDQHIYKPKRSLRQWEERGAEKNVFNDYQAGNTYYGEEVSAYFEDEMTLLPSLAVNAGIRAVLFLVKGKTYVLPEPRIALRYDLSGSIALKASYTWMNQFEHRLETTYVDLPTNLWLPSTASIQPMHSQQVAVGAYVRLPEGMHVDVEGFWKTMEHLYEYSGPSALYPPVDRWESAFTEGQGRSYGAEVSFGRKWEKIDVDIAYTLSWTERFFAEFSDNWYPDRNDNRHKFNVTATHKFSKRFEIYGAWLYHSGNRMTIVSQGKYRGTPYMHGMPFHSFGGVYSSPNNIKLPDYHRLDLGMNFIKVRPDGKVRTWNFSIYNVYCRLNTVYAYMSVENGKYIGRSYGIIPIIPTMSYTLKF